MVILKYGDTEIYNMVYTILNIQYATEIYNMVMINILEQDSYIAYLVRIYWVYEIILVAVQYVNVTGRRN